MENFTGKHIKIVPAVGRTGWRVDNKSEGYELAYIDYFPNWKKHVFNPLDNTIYDKSCLKDIITFLEKLDASSN